MRFVNVLCLPVFVFLASCADRLPGVGILAPESPAGYEMDATGLKGSYYYTFSEDGTYDRETVLPSGREKELKRGIWSWDRSSISDAKLTLDNDLVVDLNFTTHEHANASLEGSKRLYPVEFTAP